MAATLLTTYGEYGAAEARGTLSPEALHHAKRAVVDWFSTVYPGSRIAPATVLVKAHARELGAGRSSLPGFATTAHPALAAWINGSASHSVEFDDIFKDGVYHPGCPTIAAALAAAEDRGASGEAFLRAVIAGYEIATRIAVAVQPSHYRFFHTTGTAGVFGGAAAASMLFAPGEAQALTHALATAGTFASGLQQAFRSDSMTKPLHAGHGAQVGILAAQGATHGLTGALDLLEGEAGFGAAMSTGARWENATEGLGSRYNITQMTFKNHGCCGHAFAAIDAIVALRAQGLTPATAKSIRIEGYRATLDVAGIPNPLKEAEAKFSTHYTVAHALVHGSVRLDAFSPERLADPAIREVMKRITLVEDPALTKAFPNQRAARVTVETTDGRTLSHFSPCRKGDPEAPLTDADLDGKFLELVAPVAGDAKAKALLAKLWRLETLDIPALELV